MLEICSCTPDFCAYIANCIRGNRFCKFSRKCRARTKRADTSLIRRTSTANDRGTKSVWNVYQKSGERCWKKKKKRKQFPSLGTRKDGRIYLLSPLSHNITVSGVRRLRVDSVEDPQVKRTRRPFSSRQGTPSTPFPKIISDDLHDGPSLSRRKFKEQCRKFCRKCRGKVGEWFSYEFIVSGWKIIGRVGSSHEILEKSLYFEYFVYLYFLSVFIFYKFSTNSYRGRGGRTNNWITMAKKKIRIFPIYEPPKWK